ncbi:hypothetical protein CKW48_21650, partial [Bordetella pertussis]
FVSFRQKAARYTTFLAVINASGQPAASVPLHIDGQGLPIGVRIVSPEGGPLHDLPGRHQRLGAAGGQRAPAYR